MVAEIVVSPPVGSLEELRPEDLILVTPGAPMSMSLSTEPNGDRLLVFDLNISNIQGVFAWLENAGPAQRNATIVVLGTSEQLRRAQEPLSKFDIGFIEKPQELPDDQILQFLYDQLGSVYAPFRRVGVQFSPASAVNEAQLRQTANQQQQLLDAIFGEHAETIEPVVTGIDPAYSQPPLAITPAEHDQLLAHLRKPETEERTDSD